MLYYICIPNMVNVSICMVDKTQHFKMAKLALTDNEYRNAISLLRNSGVCKQLNVTPFAKAILWAHNFRPKILISGVEKFINTTLR